MDKCPEPEALLNEAESAAEEPGGVGGFVALVAIWCHSVVPPADETPIGW